MKKFKIISNISDIFETQSICHNYHTSPSFKNSAQSFTNILCIFALNIVSGSIVKNIWRIHLDSWNNNKKKIIIIIIQKYLWLRSSKHPETFFSVVLLMNFNLFHGKLVNEKMYAGTTRTKMIRGECTPIVLC